MYLMAVKKLLNGNEKSGLGCIILGDYVRGSLNKFTDFFRMGTFIDTTHMKH